MSRASFLVPMGVFEMDEPALPPARWQQVKTLFHAALDLDPACRAAFLDEVCGPDASLHKEILSLLAAHEQAKVFLEAPALAGLVESRQGPEASASAGTPAAGLSIGQIFLGKYRLDRVLGQGGMGVVYEATDTYIGRRVALKTIRLEATATEERTQDLARRLAREARAEGRLVHPNVVVVHDAGDAEGLSYVVMELIEGVPLADLLRHGGPLPRPRALLIALQIARALGYAQERGVLHRDVKPSNVLVCAGDLVKVADFGLAKLLTESASFTKEGRAMGTPAYMSPEQIRAETVDGRSDLFSLAGVLYQCLTSQPPFKADELHAVLYQVLEAPFRPLDLADPGLTQAYTAFFERALAKEPAARFADAAAFIEALERLAALESGVGATSITPAAGAEASTASVPAASAVPRPARPRRPWRRPALAALAAGVLLAGAVGTYLVLPEGRRGPAGQQAAGLAAASVRRSVAVLGFKNLSNDPDKAWLSTALSEMLGMELAAGEKLRVLPGENVARMKIELDLADTDSFAQDTLQRIRLNLGTDLVVIGSYLALGEKFRLDLRVQDAAAGETIAQITDTGTEAQLFVLVSRVGARMRESLGVAQRTSAEADAVRTSLPSSPEAARLYSEGMEKLRRFDGRAARDLLEKAVASEPEFPLAHWALAEAWTRLGYDGKAKEEAKKAFELAGKLSRQERLAVEARYHKTLGEQDKALEIYQTLWEFFPDNLDYGLELADVQLAVGKTKAAFATVEALRKLPPPIGDDPRLDLKEAALAGFVGEFRRMQAAASRAAETGKARAMHFVVARARIIEADAFYGLGEPGKVIEAYEDAKRICAEAGDQTCVADVLYFVGYVHLAQGTLDEAKRSFGESGVSPLSSLDLIGPQRHPGSPDSGGGSAWNSDPGPQVADFARSRIRASSLRMAKLQESRLQRTARLGTGLERQTP